MSESVPVSELGAAGVIAVPIRTPVTLLAPGLRARAMAALPLASAPLVLTALLAVTAFSALPAVRTVTEGPAIEAALRRPLLHVALAPVSSVLDAMSLLSVRQHLALLATVLVLHLLVRVVRGLTRRRPWRVALRRECLWAAGVFLLVVGVYGYGLLVPRPMAALTLADPSLLAVDFHSHTDASHDGRPGFTAESNREWHRAAGFDVSYISDHRTQRAVLEARALNPGRAGDGTMLLPAIEVVCRREHLVFLGPIGEGKSNGCAPGGTGADPLSVAFFTMPGNPARLPDLPPLVGAEVINAAPRSFDEPPDEWSMLRAHAESHDLALVASSNNHGWGRTAAAWSVMRVPGWRAMNHDQLDLALRGALLAHRNSAVSVVERVRPVWARPSAAGLAMTVPTLGWHVVRTLSAEERLVWAAWAWLAWAAGMLRQSIRRQRLDQRPVAVARSRAA